MAVFQNASGGANNNFNAGTSGQTNEFFVPEIFSKKIQNFFRKSSVIEAITNTDYAGEIAAFGDTVKIIKEPEITVAAYTRAASTTKQYLTDQELTLVIDKANSFKFIVDDIEEKLSHINYNSYRVRWTAGLAWATASTGLSRASSGCAWAEAWPSGWTRSSVFTTATRRSAMAQLVPAWTTR